MKRIISVFLILLLLLPAGCKKQPTETASPGEVVEKKETGTSDTVVKKEETNISDESPSEPVKQPEDEPVTGDLADIADLYICYYFVKVKEEHHTKGYDASDFSEITCTKAMPFYNFTRTYILTTETKDLSKAAAWEQSLLKRTDLEKAYMLSYIIMRQNFEEKDTLTQTSLSISGDTPDQFDVIQVSIKSSIVSKKLLSTKHFSDYPIEAIEVLNGLNDEEKYQENFLVNLYIKKNSQITLEEIITSLEKKEYLSSVKIYSSFDYPN